MTREEALLYEMPTIAEYISNDILRSWIGGYMAYKVKKKIKRYNSRLEIIAD